MYFSNVLFSVLFCVKGYIKVFQTSKMELFCENIEQLKANYFFEKALSYMYGRACQISMGTSDFNN